MIPACKSCRYMEVVVVDDDDDVPFPDVICRRFPPSDGNWSVVKADDWCGEFAPREDS